MTCIVGVETKRGAIIGGDSLAGDDWYSDVRAEPKVFRLRDYVFGFTTSFRMGDLLKHHLSLPTPPIRGVHKHLVTVAIPAIRECLKAGGFATTKDGAEVGGDFLIGVRGGVYHVASDYQVGRSAHGYAAIGCGGQIARGALYASAGMAPRRRVKVALEAAARHCMGVVGPWHIVETRRP